MKSENTMTEIKSGIGEFSPPLPFNVKTITIAGVLHKEVTLATVQQSIKEIIAPYFNLEELCICSLSQQKIIENLFFVEGKKFYNLVFEDVAYNGAKAGKWTTKRYKNQVVLKGDNCVFINKEEGMYVAVQYFMNANYPGFDSIFAVTFPIETVLDGKRSLKIIVP